MSALPVPVVPPSGGGPEDPTSLGVAQANQLAATRVMVAQLNGNLKSIYLTAFNNWKISVDAGRLPNSNPPLPPKGYVISGPDEHGFQWPVEGPDPVCDIPTIPPDRSKTQQELQAEIPTGTFRLGPAIVGSKGGIFGADGDNLPDGAEMTTLAPEGGVMKVRKRTVPFGAYWERIG